jgi:hypothetical protein
MTSSHDSSVLRWLGAAAFVVVPLPARVVAGQPEPVVAHV